MQFHWWFHWCFVSVSWDKKTTKFKSVILIDQLAIKTRNIPLFEISRLLHAWGRGWGGLWGGIKSQKKNITWAQSYCLWLRARPCWLWLGILILDQLNIMCSYQKWYNTRSQCRDTTFACNNLGYLYTNLYWNVNLLYVYVRACVPACVWGGAVGLGTGNIQRERKSEHYVSTECQILYLNRLIKTRQMFAAVTLVRLLNTFFICWNVNWWNEPLHITCCVKLCLVIIDQPHPWRNSSYRQSLCNDLHYL